MRSTGARHRRRGAPIRVPRAHSRDRSAWCWRRVTPRPFSIARGADVVGSGSRTWAGAGKRYQGWGLLNGGTEGGRPVPVAPAVPTTSQVAPISASLPTLTAHIAVNVASGLRFG